MASAAIAASVVAPGPSAAQEPSAEEQRDTVRDQAVAVAAEIDVLDAQDAEIQAVLADLQVQVAGQQVVVAQATDAQASADAAVAASAEQIAALEAETVALNAAIDQMIVDAYLHPPMDHTLDAFKADTVSDAAFKNGIVDIQSAEDAATLTRLGEAEDELTVQKAQQEGLAAEAAQAKGEADAAMADLDTVVAAQNQLATEVQSRLDAKNAEAVALAASDAALSQQIQAEQAALAAALASSRQTGRGQRPRAGWRPCRVPAAGPSPWRGRSPATSRRCSTRRRPTASSCAVAATAIPPTRSRCDGSTAAPRITPSTRCRRRSAARRPPGRDRRCTNRAWPWTSPATAAAR